MIVQTYEERTVAGPAASREDVDWFAPARSRTSWGAIFAGVITTMVVQLLLTVLGMAVGLTATNAVLTQEAMGDIGWGAGLWWVVSGIISLFAGGCVAGRLSGVRRDGDAMLHGFLTWGLATVISAFAVTTAMGSVVGGSFSDLQRGMLPATPGTASAGSTEGSTADEGITVDEGTRRNLVSASWWTFFALLLGAGAAALGGRVGMPERAVERTAYARRDAANAPPARM